MLQFILRVVLIVPIFPLLACSTNSKDAGEPPKGWLRHTSPMGFSIDYPADWQVLADPQRGRFTVFKAGGLFQMDGSITIRPMFLPGRHLDEREAGTLLSQLGNNLHTEESIFGMNANARWSAPKYSRGFATITSDEPFKEVAILYWAGSARGTVAILYYLVSSLDKYASVAPIYEKILESFRILNDQPAGGKSAAGGRPSLGQIQYVRWTDPLENAFSMSVPQGWKALGGMYRKSALDTRPALTLLSPSGGVCIKMGSPEVGIFMEPLYTAMGNMTRGSLPQHDGTQLEIRPYQPGAQFGRYYVEKYLGQECGNLRIGSNSDRADLAPQFLQEARTLAPDLPAGVRLTAGEVTYSCIAQGVELTGYFAAGTVLLPAQPLVNGRGGALWAVFPAYGYLSLPGLRQDAERIGQQVLASFQVHPQWQQKQRQMSQSIVIGDTLESQRLRERAQQAIAEDERQTSDLISRSYWAQQERYDEISRKRENGILGTVDVVDPYTSKQYKVESNSNFYWMSDQGYIGGTLAHDPPSGGPWREMIQRP